MQPLLLLVMVAAPTTLNVVPRATNRKDFLLQAAAGAVVAAVWRLGARRRPRLHLVAGTFARLTFARLTFARLAFARLTFARLTFARLTFARLTFAR